MAGCPPGSGLVPPRARTLLRHDHRSSAERRGGGGSGHLNLYLSIIYLSIFLISPVKSVKDSHNAD